MPLQLLAATEKCMRGSPGLLTSFGNLESSGKIIKILENQFNGDTAFVFRDDLLAEVLFENS